MFEIAEASQVSSWRSAKFGTRARTVLKAATVAVLATGLMAATPKASEANPKYAAIVVDTATGKVLYEANPDSRRYPASLTKMMTLYVLFEDLERGRFKLGSKFTVSPNAAAQPPSKLGLKPGQTITAEDAIKALVTKSANDVAAVVGENVSGSVPAFADRMTRTARALGMKSTVFKNPHGLPNSGQYTTARDMMKLGVALQVRFPKYYGYFTTRSFTFRGKTMGNHNRLLGSVQGVDGIKTGFINASGFNLVSSVKRDGRKIVAVVMGGRTARSRDDHMRELIASYLPKASRGKGYDAGLVAAVENAPKVAAGGVVAAAAIPPSLSNHPRPVPRPAVAPVYASAGVDPAVVAAALAPVPPEPAAAPSDLVALLIPPAEAPSTPKPAEARVVRTLALPVPDAAPAVTAGLPSSAEEAFGDIGQLAQGDADAKDVDALAAIIDARIRATAFDAVEEIEIAPPVQIAAAVPSPPPAKASRKSDVPTEAISGWLIQIGAVGSEEAANALLDKARGKAGKVLAGAEPVTETLTKGKQTFVRARFAGFDSQKAAQNACAALKKSEFACFALRL
ncbi:MAG TPA: D-alanyl-D-alanine carboxypeptidase [Methylomirabilota bacterium]|nr:D-alanyl-D-alanine carboxypeptidase [Methylomirabilota bacterium]